MKPRPEIIGEKVELLGLYKDVTPEEMEAARAQALKVLESATDQVESEISVLQPVRATRRWQWPAAATIAAAIALAVLLPSRVLQSAPAVLEDASGQRKIQYGELVRPTGDMSAMLSMTNGPRVETRSMSEFMLERTDDGGTRIRLNMGGLIVDAASQRGASLYVQTRDITALVSGAVSLVNAGEEGSSVTAIGGEVRVTQGVTERKLGPGEQVTSNPKMESLSMKDELFWSRELVAHIARLEQATRVPVAQTPAPPASKEERVAFEEATIRPAVPLQAANGPNARGGGGGGAISQDCNVNPNRFQLDPRRLSIRNVSLHELVAWSYGACRDLIRQSPFSRITGGPDWIKADRWDIEALIRQGSVDPLPTTTFGGPVTELAWGRSPKVQQMLRTLVEERFKVVVRRETKETPVYVLTVLPGGPKFQGNDYIDANTGMRLMGAGMLQRGNTPADRQAAARGGALLTAAQGAITGGTGTGPCYGERNEGCIITSFTNQFMDNVAIILSGNDMMAGRPVINRTNIQERVSFAYQWKATIVPGQLPSPLSFKELAGHLATVGLELKEDPKGLIETFVIERVEKPSEN